MAGIGPTGVMVVIDLWVPWTRGMATGISRYAATRRSWRLMLVSADAVPARRPESVAGVVGTLFPNLTPDWVLRAPSVSLYPGPPMSPSRRVAIDAEEGARMVLEHLLERDIPHLGMLTAKGERDTRKQRAQAFVDLAAEAGRSVHRLEMNLRRNQPMTARQSDRLARWLGDLPRPMGLMAIDDDYGYHAITACHAAGLNVPDDVAVVGAVNDQPICEFCQPTLSSLMADQNRIGYEGAALLERLMQGEPAPEGPTLISPLGVLTRGSSDVQQTADPALGVALRYIRDHIAEGIGPQDVVDHCPASGRTLQRRFRELRGRTLGEELRRARITLTQRYLLAGDAALAEVAAAVGYKYLSQMCRDFKAVTGMTPTRYRQRFRTPDALGMLHPGGRL